MEADPDEGRRRGGGRGRAGEAAARLSRAGVLLLLAIAQPAFGQQQALPSAAAELRAGALSFRYQPGQRRIAEALAAATEIPPRMPGLPADVLAHGEIIIWLAPDEATFQALAPASPDWSAGIAFPEGDEIVLPVFGRRLGGVPVSVVLRHELAHVALTRYLGPGTPRWFQEGYAQLAAGSWNAGSAWTLRFAILLGRVPSLQSLDLDFRHGRLPAEHAYLLSYTAVDFLYRLGGPEGFAHLLRRWRETGDLDTAMRTTYGFTFGQIERLWHKDLGRRFGWLLLLAQTTVFWTLMTIVLLVLGYWKKRRNRQKLAALEAAAWRAPESGDILEDSGDQDPWPQD